MLLIYIGLRWHTVATSCDLNAPRCTTGVGRVRVPGRCFRWSQTPPGPRWPPALGYIIWNPCSTPALLEREKKEERKKEKFYIYLDVTHTHTRPEPGQPWKARGRKKRTQTTGNRPKQRRGGRERTDLQNQPARRNGPDKNRAHTLTPRHITERHEGRIRDQMGD